MIKRNLNLVNSRRQVKNGRVVNSAHAGVVAVDLDGVRRRCCPDGQGSRVLGLLFRVAARKSGRDPKRQHQPYDK
jgi:hypothetical protein